MRRRCEIHNHLRDSETWTNNQTFPILPNLLPILTTLDPSKPTYIGTSLGHHSGYMYYFEGMMYGFNWGVVSPQSLSGLWRPLS